MRTRIDRKEFLWLGMAVARTVVVLPWSMKEDVVIADHVDGQIADRLLWKSMVGFTNAGNVGRIILSQ